MTAKKNAAAVVTGIITARKIKDLIGKGVIIMKIAVTYENEQVFQHFGHTEHFKIYTVENGKVISSMLIDTNGSGHGALAEILSSIETDVLICGGIGSGAQAALAEAGIKLFGGCSGKCDDAVNAFIAGNLAYNPDVKCNHHEHEHNNCQGHSCGSHNCKGNA